MQNDLKQFLNEYKKFSQVKAIALGGSNLANTFDNKSDIDIYIFTEEDIPLDKRLDIVKAVSNKYEIGGEYFGAGDEFFVNALEKQLDVMFWNIHWFEDVVKNTWIKHLAQNGYTTCFLYTLSICDIVYDKDNWLKSLKDLINTEYPQQLKKNIIKRNMMLLKDKPFASYYEQIEKALKREDIVSVNHRLSAFISSYFDILFAINEKLHCGEKRLISYAKNNLKILPKDFEENLKKVLKQPNGDMLEVLDNMVKNLKEICE